MAANQRATRPQTTRPQTARPQPVRRQIARSLTSRAVLRWRSCGLVALLLAPLLLGGCAYSSRRLTDFPTARTIAIVPFSNTGFYRDMELELTRRVVQEVRARSSLAMSDVDSADLILRGGSGVFETPVVLDKEGDIIQKRLEGWLDVTITERATGRVVRQARIRATADFRPGIYGESLPGSATQIWTRRVAEQVAQLLETGF